MPILAMFFIWPCGCTHSPKMWRSNVKKECMFHFQAGFLILSIFVTNAILIGHCLNAIFAQRLWNLLLQNNTFLNTNHTPYTASCHISGWLPTAAESVRSCQVMCVLWWTKWHLGRFSPSTLASPTNSRSTNCSTFINHPASEAISSRHWQRR
jgi:hypothetical protein